MDGTVSHSKKSLMCPHQDHVNHVKDVTRDVKSGDEIPIYKVTAAKAVLLFFLLYFAVVSTEWY